MNCRPKNWDKIRDKLIEENASEIRNAIPLCYPLIEAVADTIIETLHIWIANKTFLEGILKRADPHSLVVLLPGIYDKPIEIPKDLTLIGVTGREAKET